MFLGDIQGSMVSMRPRIESYYHILLTVPFVIRIRDGVSQRDNGVLPSQRKLFLLDLMSSAPTQIQTSLNSS